MPGDCFRLLNLASSSYLCIDDRHGSEDAVHVKDAVKLRLCLPTDKRGMDNSFFKLAAATKHEEDETQEEAKQGQYYCLVSAIKGRYDQVRVSNVRVHAEFGKDGLVAKTLTDHEIEAAERRGKDPAVAYPRQLCFAYHMQSENDYTIQDVRAPVLLYRRS